MKTQNLNHKSSPPTYGCLTRIRHWGNNSGHKVQICYALDCSQPAQVDGRVLYCSTAANTRFSLTVEILISGGQIQLRNLGQGSWGRNNSVATVFVEYIKQTA